MLEQIFKQLKFILSNFPKKHFYYFLLGIFFLSSITFLSNLELQSSIQKKEPSNEISLTDLVSSVENIDEPNFNQIKTTDVKRNDTLFSILKRLGIKDYSIYNLVNSPNSHLLSKIKGDNGIQRFPKARSVEEQARNNFERHMFRDQEYHFRQYITEGKEKLFWPEGLKETDDIDAKIKEMIIPEEHYFPIREFVHNQWESDERQKLYEVIREKWQELYDKHSRDDSQEGSGLHDGNWIRLDHIPTKWSKFDLVAARELYRSTGEFPEPNFIDKCPFSGIPLEEL